jgi:hypothetical protein
MQLSLLMFVPMIPGFMFAFGSLAVAPWMALTPVFAQQVMLSDVLRGQPPTIATIALVALLTIAIGAAVAGATARLLAHERIVRRLS